MTDDELGLVLLVDKHEWLRGEYHTQSELIRKLQDEDNFFNIQVKLQSLPAGDYLWVLQNKQQPSQQYVLPYIVERKTSANLCLSIMQHKQKSKNNKTKSCQQENEEDDRKELSQLEAQFWKMSFTGLQNAYFLHECTNLGPVVGTMGMNERRLRGICKHNLQELAQSHPHTQQVSVQDFEGTVQWLKEKHLLILKELEESTSFEDYIQDNRCCSFPELQQRIKEGFSTPQMKYYLKLRTISGMTPHRIHHVQELYQTEVDLRIAILEHTAMDSLSKLNIQGKKLKLGKSMANKIIQRFSSSNKECSSETKTSQVSRISTFAIRRRPPSDDDYDGTSSSDTDDSLLNYRPFGKRGSNDEDESSSEDDDPLLLHRPLATSPKLLCKKRKGKRTRSKRQKALDDSDFAIRKPSKKKKCSQPEEDDEGVVECWSDDESKPPAVVVTPPKTKMKADDHEIIVLSD